MGKKASQETLPGMEARDVPEIEQAAENYRKIRDERCELSKRESEAKSALIQVMRNLGRSFYNYGGLRVQIETTDNVKVRATDDENDEPIGNLRSTRRSEPKINTTPASDFIAEIEEEEEGNIEAVAECSCSHLAVDHEENGPCRVIGEGGEACNCDGFAPVSPDENQERERLHSEAVARWRRERPASTEIEETKDAGGTPFQTEYPQAEINWMGEYYCADKIAAGKSVKICYVLEQPHVITGGVSKGKNWTEINAWPILPLENVGEEGVFEYKDAPKGFTYQNMKINCGSKKNPKWWVIVGPQQKFTVDYSADYPDNEIEAAADIESAAADDFTAPRCDECKRTDGGHTKECSKNPDRLTSDDYLAYAQAHYKTNHQSHARKMALTGLNDDQIRKWKLEQQQAGNGDEREPAKESKKRGGLSLVEQAIDR